MSIYGTVVSLDLSHADSCNMWVEDGDSLAYSLDESRPCTCGLPDAPLVYQGSHVLPGPDDRKGGWLDLAVIPDHITRDNHPEGREGQRKSYLRLLIGSPDSDTLYEGKPYIPGGDAALILHRRHVERLRDAMTNWLEAEEVH